MSRSIFSTVADVESVVVPSRQELLREIAAYVFPMWIWWERVEFWGAVRHALTQVGIDSAPPPPHYSTCARISSIFLRRNGKPEASATGGPLRMRRQRFDIEIVHLILSWETWSGTS